MRPAQAALQAVRSKRNADHGVGVSCAGSCEPHPVGRNCPAQRVVAQAKHRGFNSQSQGDTGDDTDQYGKDDRENDVEEEEDKDLRRGSGVVSSWATTGTERGAIITRSKVSRDMNRNSASHQRGVGGDHSPVVPRTA